MKTKKSFAFFVLLIALFLVGSINVYGATKNTAFQIQNLSATTASITIQYFDSAGNEVTAAQETATIPANSSIQKVQSANSLLPAGCNGSVVIASDQPIAAITNQQAIDGTQKFQGSYTGIGTPANNFFLPVALKGFAGFFTEISVQNAGTTPVDVIVKFFDPAGTEIVAAQSAKTGLLAGGAVRFDQGVNAGLPAGFRGSAKVEATGPVVAMVNQDDPTKHIQQTYNGFAAGDTTLFIPVVLNAFGGFNSAFQIQNVGTLPTTVTVTYSDGIVKTSNSIGPNQAALFVQAGEGHSANFAGSAVVTATQPIVGIVNQASTTKASSFNAFSASATTFVLPAVLNQFFTFNSAFQCLNLGTTAATITATYSDGKVVTKTAAANAPAQFVQAGEGHVTNWAGSATVTSTQPMVCIVNQEGPTGAGDTSMSYNGIPL